MEQNINPLLIFMSFMFETSNIDDMKAKLLQALKDKDYDAKELAKTLNISIDDIKTTIENLKSILNKQSENQGISVGELLKQLQ